MLVLRSPPGSAEKPTWISIAPASTDRAEVGAREGEVVAVELEAKRAGLARAERHRRRSA